MSQDLNEKILQALKPFADYARQMNPRWGMTHDDSAFYGVKRPGAHQITYGDFRNAVRVYDAATKNGTSEVLSPRVQKDDKSGDVCEGGWWNAG